MLVDGNMEVVCRRVCLWGGPANQYVEGSLAERNMEVGCRRVVCGEGQRGGLKEGCLWSEIKRWCEGGFGAAQTTLIHTFIFDN